MPKPKELKKDIQERIRMNANTYAALQRVNTDFAGWLQLKFSCDRRTAVKYADWWDSQPKGQA